MDIQLLLEELENFGIGNDTAQTDYAKKYLNITRNTGEFLSMLIKISKSSRILEFGTSNGYSTLWLASALGDGGLVKTIEQSERKFNEAQNNFERSGISHKIDQIQGEATGVAKTLNDSEFDFIFMDTCRTIYTSMISDILKILKPNGLIVCDNAVSHEHEMLGFMEYFKAASEFTTCVVPIGKGQFIAHRN